MDARVLLLEDVETDAVLSRHELERAGVAATWLRVETREEFERALVEFKPDVVLSDFSLPGFDGPSALKIARSLLPDTPFIFVSGTIGEDRAVEAMRQGATDYVLKNHLERLVPVVTRAIREAKTLGARRRAEHALRLTQFAVDHAHGAVLQIAPDGALHYANEAACLMLGHSREQLLALNIRDLNKVSVEAWTHYWGELKNRASMVFEAEYRHRDGQPLPLEIAASYIGYDGAEYAFFYVSDVTDRKAAELRIRHLANYDALTSLPNRNLLHDRLHQALHLAHRYQLSVAVVCVGLDRFKLVNDTLGYAAGDKVLQLAASRISACVRDVDTVARIGGDEFALVLAGGAQEEVDGAVLAVQRILGAFSQPALMGEREIFVTCSIGVAVYPHDGRDAEALLQNSSAAMYRAKEQGRNNYQLYTAANSPRASVRLSMETGLRHALERDELRLYYQPQVCLRTGHVVGLEALLRWTHPEMGPVPPDTFIRVAEETGLILPIGEWVLHAACTQVKAWHAQGMAPLRLAVNLSARQFRHKDLATKVATTLAQTGFDPHSLELELTESMLVQNVEAAIRVMAELKQLDVHISLDDFGTGYSSLSHLQRFPIDTLKIDRSFVRDITCDRDSAAIADAIIAMAHSLRLQVIAEGVETMGQLAVLHTRGCDQIQGYLFSKPLPPEDLEQLLTHRHSLALPSTAKGAAKPTVLLVDDEANMVAALRRALRGEGYRVLGVDSAEAAFEVLAQKAVHVIVAGLHLPEMNGAEFLARAKDLYPQTVRLMLNESAELQALGEAVHRAAVYKFLPRPWADGPLREQLREAFRRYGADHKRP